MNRAWLITATLLLSTGAARPAWAAATPPQAERVVTAQTQPENPPGEPRPDLVVELAPAADLITSGAPQHFTLTVRNAGSAPAAGVRMEAFFRIPEGGSVDLGPLPTPGNGFACSAVPPKGGLGMSCGGGTLEPGASVAIPVEVIWTVAEPQAIPGWATVDPDDAVPEQDEQNNGAGAVTQVSPPGPAAP